jgi:hypothetical protein
MTKSCLGMFCILESPGMPVKHAKAELLTGCHVLKGHAMSLVSAMVTQVQLVILLLVLRRQQDRKSK